ncbi:MAG: hypothetical protein LPJ89_11535 [Hymenobacteraceae bacterium]|nr:hypothetical protein [Hymenobacteraceae bacterium]MDX5398003.1 hypothetical protein [Hymenobacteraceae bacterium]MDX5444398.1 hypothetical protein [Hymenobacteraceae bacterium]MDX5514075.1 hypothetical protein [Hymenobacteraceae bacterium]
MKRLQEKWGVGPLQVVLILIVFALTGSTVVAIKKPLFALLGVAETEPAWLQTVMYLLFVFPLYQSLLLFYGFLFGQFNFFWEKEKKLLRLIARPFQRRRS